MKRTPNFDILITVAWDPVSKYISVATLFTDTRTTGVRASSITSFLEGVGDLDSSTAAAMVRSAAEYMHWMVAPKG